LGCEQILIPHSPRFLYLVAGPRLLALASPELEVLAITVTFGTKLPYQNRNALTVLRQYPSGLLLVSTSLILTSGSHKFEPFPCTGKTFSAYTTFSNATLPRFPATGTGLRTLPSPERRYWRSGRRTRHPAVYIPLNTFTVGTRNFPGSPDCGITLDSRFHSDGLGDITTRHPDLQAVFADKGQRHPQLEISSRSAVDVSLDLIRSEPDKSITYIALGPLTDLSGMLKKDPALVRERLGRVVCMGGALDVPGNSTSVAECQESSLST
jgi:hypothetical protein